MKDEINNQFSELQIKTNLQKSGSVIVMDRSSLAIQADLSDPSTGYVFTPTKRPVYNTDELKKVIDTEVTELVPTGPETDLDLVPGPLYRDTVESLEEARRLIEEQSKTIAELETRISDLESQIATLQADLDNATLLQILAEANAENLQQQLLLINDNAQAALQRSILEGTEKSSLSGRNEGLYAQVQALKSEVVSLNEQISQLEDQLFGKQAAIEAGAKAGTDIAVRVINKSSLIDPDLTYRARAQDDGRGTWINGGDVEVFNFSKESVKVDIKETGVFFLSANTPKSINLSAGQKVVLKLEVDFAKVDGYQPSAGFTFKGDKQYEGGLAFTTSTGTVSLSTAVQKRVAGKFRG